MFRPMRRKRQQLTDEETAAIFRKGTSGVLALSGDDDYPYAVPISYVYSDGKIYFHGAKKGHKPDSIRRSPKASFCVIDQDNVVKEEYTTYFRSAIAFGKIREVQGDEILQGLEFIGKRYFPEDDPANLQKAITRELPASCVFCLEIEHMTGKESIELRNAK